LYSVTCRQLKNEGGRERKSGCYKGAVKKQELAKGLAAESGLTEAEAADRLDGVVHEIVTKLKKGRPAALPGLGCFSKGRDGVVSFVRERGRRHA
jgi:hypothetical protein